MGKLSRTGDVSSLEPVVTSDPTIRNERPRPITELPPLKLPNGIDSVEYIRRVRKNRSMEDVEYLHESVYDLIHALAAFRDEPTSAKIVCNTILLDEGVGFRICDAEEYDQLTE